MTVKADPANCLLRREIESIQFGFYTDQNVLDRSVLAITSSVTYDPNGTPLPGGLYDPRLGVTASDDGKGRNNKGLCCITCAGDTHACPGHCGHIQLHVPLFHPLLLPEIISALLCKCFHCHHLRKGRDRPLQIMKAKLLLLYQDRIKEYQALETTLGKVVYQRPEHEKMNSKVKTNAAVKAVLEPILEQAAAVLSGGPLVLPSSSYHQMEHLKLCKQIVAYCKLSSSPCQYCGAYSPKVRHDAHNKVFLKPLSATMAKRNRQEGIPDLTKINLSSKSETTPDDDEDDNIGGYNSDDTTERKRNAMEDSSEEEEDNDETQSPEQATTKRDVYMPTLEIEAHLLKLWKQEPFLCQCLWGHHYPSNGKKRNASPWILRVIPVPPNRFRAAMSVGNVQVQHIQTAGLAKMIQLNTTLGKMLLQQQQTSNSNAFSMLCIQLQMTYNGFIDADKNGSTSVEQNGIRQLLEKKQGLLRNNMMGKRVNYSCRSVISPDPYVGTHEMGIPLYFCETLTYNVPVTEFNLSDLRQSVERGPGNYPGARWVQLGPHRRVDLSRMGSHERKGIAAKLMVGKDIVVGRQMRDGDYVLMNRQPTLHKPGIMAHRVRVLHNPDQKTIRMHYANCNTYNADFDGDEMNCHFPQNELGRAEAKYLAQTHLQYIVPTDGTPLRGLIQDHVVAGVKMTQKDTFFEKWEYQQLLFAAISGMSGLELVHPSSMIETMPPAILKPRKLWTGKQVISTLLLHLRKGNDDLAGLSTERKAKTPPEAFGSEQDEHLVLIRDGELLRGVLDKSAFGAADFSMVHATYEAYGPEKASMLLNALGRLFTGYIQYYSGHSCRVEDLVLTQEAEEARKVLVRQAYNAGCRAAKSWAESEGGKMTIPPDGAAVQKELKAVEKATAAMKIGELLTGSNGMENFAALDSFMQGQLNPLSSAIIKECLPDGLEVPFPHNTFGIMTTTGAKGSIVNQSQVTCALGQQALEGRRVPRMSSGRTLPSFAPYDPSPRSDGFVLDRFLTGIRPQEYYFHCMAGREGLVDTAVKTSRSGYLQRCLVKHLEELKVAYDHTVRNSEGGVIQFLYGEDGLDPTRASYLDCTDDSFMFMARNYPSLRRHNSSLPSSTVTIAASESARYHAVKNGCYSEFKKGDSVLARRLRFGTKWVRGALCQGWKLATLTSVSSSHVSLTYHEDGHKEKRIPLELKKIPLVKPYAPDPALCSDRNGQRVGSSGACVSERVAAAALSSIENDPSIRSVMKQTKLSHSAFSSLVGAKYSSSLCAPGEAVGCIAAQSVGEPSTQMTLNTFHLAGSGANVTLGIPRLREIIMSASKTPKTPTMSVPMCSWVSEEAGFKLARKFEKLSLIDLVHGDRGITVTERLEEDSPGLWLRAYYVTLKLHDAERISRAFGLSIQDIAEVVAGSFVPALSLIMKKELRQGGHDVAEIRGSSSSKQFLEDEPVNKPAAGAPARTRKEADDNDDEVDEDDDPMDEEDGVTFSRRLDSDDDDDSDNSVTETDDEQASSETESDRTNQEAKLNDQSTPVVNKATNSISLQALKVEPDARPLLMVGLVEQAASRTVVRSKSGIDMAFINDESERGRCLQTAGSNLQEMWKLEQVVHRELVSNDVWAMRCAYGVEAARHTILDQIRAVFGVYGIEVDMRHLSLISDYMTFDGNFRAMSRGGMASNSSTFLQMSFETTTNFLKHASLFGSTDKLCSPSANIILGKPVEHGTGSFSLMTDTSPRFQTRKNSTL